MDSEKWWMNLEKAEGEDRGAAAAGGNTIAQRQHRRRLEALSSGGA